jgi:hypothetical protein
MALDGYSKIVFTVIAVALTVIGVKQLEPTPATAQLTSAGGQYLLAASATGGAWILDGREGGVFHCSSGGGGLDLGFMADAVGVNNAREPGPADVLDFVSQLMGDCYLVGFTKFGN